MSDKINILVTGCGGDIGQSIGKILKNSNLVKSVFGTDLTMNHAGVFIYDACYILPRCDNENYLNSLKGIIEKNNINVLIPISEAEIRFFHENNITEEKLNVKIIIANKEALEVGLDKYKTSIFLKNSNLPFPITNLMSNKEEMPFPFIIKSRLGSGSKNVFLAKDVTDLTYLENKFPDFIKQEYLNKEAEEYTCGLYRSTQGEVRSIIVKRTLMGGFTGYGEVCLDKEITRLLSSIAVKLNLIGSINIQLRNSDKGPCVFEINPRFSSTVRFRDMLGFNDLIWSLQDNLHLSIDPYTSLNEGKKIYKGFSEYIG